MNKIILSIISVWLIFLTVFFFVNKGDKNAVVDLNRIYQEFNMTKELTNNFEIFNNRNRTILDSLGLQLLKHKKGSDEYTRLSSVYQNQQQHYLKKSTEMSEMYDNKIWKHIYKYIDEYGVDNNYESILGKMDNGILLYSNDESDITNKLIQYLNKKYEGF